MGANTSGDYRCRQGLASLRLRTKLLELLNPTAGVPAPTAVPHGVAAGAMSIGSDASSESQRTGGSDSLTACRRGREDGSRADTL